MSVRRNSDARIRKLERMAQAGDRLAAAALWEHKKRAGIPPWIDVEGDRYWVVGVDTEGWPVGMGVVRLEDQDTLIVAEDRDVAGEGYAALIRAQVAADPTYPHRMVPEAAAAWEVDRPAFLYPGAGQSGVWFPTLEAWIEGHAEYPEMLDSGGVERDVDDYDPVLGRRLGFEPTVAYRVS